MLQRVVYRLAQLRDRARIRQLNVCQRHAVGDPLSGRIRAVLRSLFSKERLQVLDIAGSVASASTRYTNLQRGDDSHEQQVAGTTQDADLVRVADAVDDGPINQPRADSLGEDATAIGLPQSRAGACHGGPIRRQSEMLEFFAHDIRE
jgi:hypothetical protein